MQSIAKMIDHTLLKPDATSDQIMKLCQEAMQYNFASVCINPHWIPLAKETITQDDVKICTVVGFPLGANSTKTKVVETQDAIKMGAEEIDMVLNISKVKEGDFIYVEDEIKQVVQASAGHIVKVILETCLLTEEEIITACQSCIQAGAQFVKTSTGFSTRGATVEDVLLMKKTVGDHCEVKAAGGVRTMSDMMKMIKAGASRIGTSAGVSLIQNLESSESY
ncbi:deoxyribose-phosphate aldolase [Entomospira entomophila]|uniref:Deoxyribose-phosphate aldolase n=1 Tax=Entomospira entomophila TaxID=2719988 RepID=A0A968GB33_9SPIO|nr:deoxyribose-phosphate aldolase [Entomospira entomophilus]NIZ40373.1 deoxyribose-phosphate aldolase [Entomospira entomophilus]WDI35932.1 deoxyribose-phosphate aldolase [Entomospira entomophilus]